MRRAAFLVLTVVILAPAGVRGATWFRAHDGVLREACCCPQQARHHETSRPATPSEVRSACCCTTVELAARDGSLRDAPPAAPELAPRIAQAVAAVAPAVPTGVTALDAPYWMRGPPTLSGLFVRHCALLL